MFCNTFLRHLDVMMVIYLLLMKIQRFWYYAEYDGSKTHWFSQILKVSFCYHVKYDCSKTSDEITSATSYFWYYAEYDGSKTHWFSQILKVSFCYHVKYDCSKTSDEITSATSYFWYRVKRDGSKTSQHVYIKIIVFQKVLKTLLYD